jgi:hypothetical protein
MTADLHDPGPVPPEPSGWPYTPTGTRECPDFVVDLAATSFCQIEPGETRLEALARVVRHVYGLGYDNGGNDTNQLWAEATLVRARREFT